MSIEIKEIKPRARKSVAIDYSKSKIYQIVNSDNDVIYIGSTTQLLSKRMYCHRSSASTRTTPFYNAMKEMGIDKFKIILIDDYSCTSKAALESREYAVMATFDQHLLYNSTINGHHSPESKQKISDALIGVKLSEKTKAKMSCSHIGLRHSPETKVKISNARIGIELSPETKLKMSEAKIGLKFSSETKRKMSDAKIGPKNHKFSRGSISDDLSSDAIKFQWQDNGTHRCKSFSYKVKRTREAAYMECLNLRNSIYPLTFKDLAAELPFNECE